MLISSEERQLPPGSDPCMSFCYISSTDSNRKYSCEHLYYKADSFTALGDFL